MNDVVPRPPDPREPRLAGRLTAALRLLDWYETTHGNDIGHDHHCMSSMKGPDHGDPGVPCSCGWDAFLDAEALMERS
jgi:hypothetical protein